MAKETLHIVQSYIAGRGRPGPVSAGATVALLTNVVANLILIPQFGIVGAAMASLISYSALALMMVVVACRLSHLSPLTIVVPRKGEVRLLWSAAGRAVSSVRARLAGRRRGAAANGATGRTDGGTPS